MKTIIILMLLTLLTISCDKNPDKLESNDSIDIVSPTIKFGIYGFVRRLEGDFSYSTQPHTGTIDSVNNKIYFYKLMKLDTLRSAMVKSNDPSFYYIDKIRTSPIFIVTPNKKGFYQADLKQGDYSGLIQIDSNELYINSFGGHLEIGPIHIDSTNLIERNFDIDYDTSW